VAYTRAEFLHKASIVHDLKYSYDKTVYKNIKSKVVITCPIHGDFMITPDKHINSGQGCPECAKERAGSNTEDFIGKARVIHGDRYDYSLVDYKYNNIPVSIVCRKHGVFYQQPVSHIRKDAHGCQQCAWDVTRNKYLKEPTILYYIKLELDGKTLYKIGITIKRVGIVKRYKNEKAKVTILAEELYNTGDIAYKYEQVLLKLSEQFAYIGEPFLRGGDTELRTKDVLCLDKDKVNNKGILIRFLKWETISSVVI
jgi:hypothetical protein